MAGIDFDQLVLEAGGNALESHCLLAELADPGPGLVRPPLVFREGLVGGFQRGFRLLLFSLQRVLAACYLGEVLAGLFERLLGSLDFLGIAGGEEPVFLDPLLVRGYYFAGMVELALGLDVCLAYGSDLPFGLHEAFSENAVAVLQLVHFGVGGAQLLVQFRRLRFDLLELVVHHLEAPAGCEDVELTKLGFEGFVAAGLAGLALQGPDLPFHFPDYVGETEQVGFRVIEFPDGLLLVGLELGDAAGFLEDCAAVLRAGAEDTVDSALFHERVGGRTDAGIHEQALDILQAAGGLIDEIVAFARAEYTPGNGDLVVLGFERLFAVGEADADLGHAHGLGFVRTIENAVLHLASAEGFCALFAQDPADCVGYIALAAAVRADDGGHSRFELELRFVRKALKTGHFE